MIAAIGLDTAENGLFKLGSKMGVEVMNKSSSGDEYNSSQHRFPENTPESQASVPVLRSDGTALTTHGFRKYIC